MPTTAVMKNNINRPRNGTAQRATWGQFHKPIFALCQALTPCAKHFLPKNASQKFRVDCKMALRLTFSLFEIDPWIKREDLRIEEIILILKQVTCCLANDLTECIF